MATAEAAPVWHKGAIRKLVMENFMTYDYIEVIPGPRLNLIIGPNGTGKSTCVCAICLCLGGEAKLLGRSKSLSDFVKNGKDRARIEVELDGGPGNAIVRIARTFSKTDSARSPGKLFWDSRAMKLSDMQANLAKKFHIDLRNLCTFLPQDRVSAFASSTPKAMLESTIASCLGNEILAEQIALASIQKDTSKDRSGIDSNRKLLKEKMDELEVVAKEKEAFEAYQRTAETVVVLRGAQAHKHFRSQQEHLKTARAAVTTSKQGLETAMAALQPQQDKVATAEVAVKKSHRQTVQAQKNARTLAKKAQEAFKSLQQIARKAAATQQAISTAHDRVRTLERELDNLVETEQGKQGEVEALKKKTEKDAERRAELQQQFQRASEAASDLKADMRGAAMERDSANQSVRRARAELAEVRAVDSRRRQIMEGSARNLKALMDFVESAQTSFSGHVIGPIAMHVSASTDLPANEILSIMEAASKNSIWRGFVVTHSSDYKTLTDKMKSLGILGCTVIQLAERDQRLIARPDLFKPRRPFELSPELRRAGAVWLDTVLGFSSDLAKSILLPALSAASAIDQTLVIPRAASAGAVQDMLSGIAPRVQAYTLTDAIRLQTSMYDKSTSTQITPIHTGNLLPRLATTVDPTEEKAKAAALAEHEEALQGAVRKHETLKQQIAAESERAKMVGSQIKRIDKARRGLKAAAQEVAELQRQIKGRTVELEKERKRCDLNASLQRLADETTKPALDGAEKTRKEITHLTKMLRDLDAHSADEATHQARLKELQDEITKLHGAVSSQKKAVEASEREAQRALTALVKLGETAMRVAPLQRCGNCPMVNGKPVDGQGTMCHCPHLLQHPPGMRSLAMLVAEGDICAKPVPTKQKPGIEQAVGDYNLDELQETIMRVEDERKEKAKTMDRNVLERYDSLLKEVRNLRTKVDAAEADYQRKHSEHAAKLTKWKYTVRHLISQVNDRFTDFFDTVGVEGEVTLLTDNEDGSEKPINDYELQIKVAFRPESDGTATMVPLDGRRQSGGERAVTTMLYLLALQIVHPRVPFRVVDEINQGMDEINERIVYEHLVTAATATAGPGAQYFVLTPKLLPGLTYRKGVTVHVVTAGPWNALRSPDSRAQNPFDMRQCIDVARAAKGLSAVDWVAHDQTAFTPLPAQAGAALASPSRRRARPEASTPSEQGEANGHARKARRGK